MCAICTSFHLAAQLGGTHLTRLRIVLPTLRTPLDSLVHLSSLSAMEVSTWGVMGRGGGGVVRHSCELVT